MINIRKLELKQKQNSTGGSFYAIALGIGILVSTVSNLVMGAIETANPKKATSYGYRRRSSMLRLSPVPSRSALMLY